MWEVYKYHVEVKNIVEGGINMKLKQLIKNAVIASMLTITVFAVEQSEPAVAETVCEQQSFEQFIFRFPDDEE